MRDLLSSRLFRLSNRIRRLESKLRVLSVIRLVSFFSILAGLILLYSFRVDILVSFGVLSILFAGFYFFVYIYNSWADYKDRLISMRIFLEREVLRSEKNVKSLFRATPIDEDRLRNHPYAIDLNVFEKDGLFSLLDTTSTKTGEKLFLDNLLQDNPPNQESIQSNQNLVRNFSKKKWFSYKFLRIASEGWEFFLGEKWSTSSWMNEKSRFFLNRSLLKKIFPIYSILSCVLILSGVFFQSPFGAPLFLLNLILFIGYRRDSLKEFKKWEPAYVRLKSVKLLLELIIRWDSSIDPSEKHEVIRSLNSSLLKFAKSYSNLGQSPVPHFIANTLYLHDLWKLSQILQWQIEFQDLTSRWIGLMERIDSLHPLIHLCFIHSGYNFPVIEESALHIDGKNLRHPLIPYSKSVSNPLSKWDMGQVLLVTGSNMSGKTTYMRTIGTNILLGLMGGPVYAEALSFPPMRIVCSVKNQDSLTEGISLFYAEVKRLAEIFRSIREKDSIHLILLDEILKGTNTKERFQASKEILNQLDGKRAFTICTTHDLDLAKLPNLVLRHFTELIQDGNMSFDYMIRDGVVETTNALFILRKEGVIS